MIIVLETSGKGEDVDSVKVKLFTIESVAKKYCSENTDIPMSENYWKYCEIVEEGKEYEMYRYKQLKIN
jgi:hypothetical protein